MMNNDEYEQEELMSILNYKKQMEEQAAIQRQPQTQSEYIAERALEVAKIKYQANTIAVGIVTAVTQVTSKFGISFKVTLDHGVFFYNSTAKDIVTARAMVDVMLPIGKKIAFQFKTKVNGSYINYTIEAIFNTF